MNLDKFFALIFGDPDTKKINNYKKVVELIKEKEEEFKNFSLDDVKAKTKEFQAKFEWLDFQKEEDSIKIKKILEEIKIEAFANVRHACKLLNWKTHTTKSGKEMEWNMIPYDVQLIWGLAIHDGSISEMKTWEWKTLVATIPAYLNALTWNSVHIVTVNDYLASRDADEMWVLYNALWLTVWIVYNSQSKGEKIKAYNSDIVYATNNELGFDYLRDNMVTKKEDKAQSPLFFAIIDEVDSILIDEARTPLIISMPDNEPTSKYVKFATLAKKLENNKHYKIDEKAKTAVLTEEWIEFLEKFLWVENIFISEHYNDIHHIENALKAMAVYIKDKDYLVIWDEVQIIDEHTWRVLAWRRYSEWLHQAIEAKEWVTIQQESKTLASITFQNYFRMYWKLAWMTGTAKTEEEEFYKVYALDTLVIPTNKPIAREDKADLLFKNEKGKFEYVVNLIKELTKTWQPILVWTVSVDKSEYLSSLLQKEWIKHEVLNAKHHENEAEIVSKAGQKWAITIATNMAWRGTDIKLWEGVVELWGLIILGTEKHETRRIDNQLRWRAWRQWDPWMTQFLISPQDDIMRIFGWDKLFWMFNWPMFANLPDNEPLAQSGMLTRRVTSVQKQVEGHHFDSRKHVLEYDDVLNKHRQIIYWKRNKILDSENIDDDIKEMIISQTERLTEKEKEELGWSLEKFEEMKKKITNLEGFYELERRIVLQSIDELWMRHIDSMSKLRENVAFEWYAQRNPLVVYKEKAFEKFTTLMHEIEYKTTMAIFNIDIVNTSPEDINQVKTNKVFNEEEIEDMLESYTPWDKDLEQNNNPLFANPNQTTTNNSKSTKKTKIRV